MSVLAFQIPESPDSELWSYFIEMQQICSLTQKTPVRRLLPPQLVFHGTSAPANGVFGVMKIADYAAWDRDT